MELTVTEDTKVFALDRLALPARAVVMVERSMRPGGTVTVLESTSAVFAFSPKAVVTVDRLIKPVGTVVVDESAPEATTPVRPDPSPLNWPITVMEEVQSCRPDVAKDNDGKSKRAKNSFFIILSSHKLRMQIILKWPVSGTSNQHH